MGLMPPPDRRPGDRYCPRCNDLQFARNWRCRWCGLSRPGSEGEVCGRAATEAGPSGSRSGVPDERVATDPWGSYVRRSVDEPDREARPPSPVWLRPGFGEPRSESQPGVGGTSVPYVIRVPDSSVRGEVRPAEVIRVAPTSPVPYVGDPVVPSGQSEERSRLLNDLEEEVRPRIEQLLRQGAAPQRILWRFTEALASELGRLRLPVSLREENNLAPCVSDALRSRGNADRLSQGEESLPAFNFEREFGDARCCLRCRKEDVGPVDRESRLCDDCTGEVWSRGTTVNHGGRLPQTGTTSGPQDSTEGEGPPTEAERIQIQDRLEELRRRGGQLVEVQRLRDERSCVPPPEVSSRPQ